VCIKQVPDTEELQKVRINRENNTLIREEIENIINPFDENAIEEALRLREKKGGKVGVISMGPPQAKRALERALAMGVDEAVLLSDLSFAGSDTLATSYTLSMGIRKMGKFDLILLGKQAIDGDTAQVGPGLAEWLNLPQITYARKIEINSKKIISERSLEGSFEVVKTPLPALVTVTKEINEPRYPSLKGVLEAKKKKITVWKSDDLTLDKRRIGLNGSPTQVIRIFTPKPPEKGEILSGEIPEVADKLIERLEKRKII
ncbi:MAG: electron transfer flavoprotein subunit beta/FixA family protein, partial [Candidatus Aerophobetes bacterium]|nr:electron transfer flavoprotein subunit beta/FixA family protein [Candidatus Aerophobetes bacterium]